MATTSLDPAAKHARRIPQRAVLRNRLVPPYAEAALWGWVGPIAVTILAAILRFDRLGIPSSKVFDEIYYADYAHDLLNHAHEVNPNGTGEFVVHPPLGNWFLALGQWIFGDNAFGWRFSAALVGSLSVLILARTVRRMTRSWLLGSIAGLLLAVDGLAYTQSRIAMLDIFVMFWVVVALSFLVLDREFVRGRLARRVPGTDDALGPRIGMRWWLVAAGLAMGCAAASKWNGVYFLPAFALLAFFWTVGARRAVGVARPFVATLRRDILPVLGCFLALVAVVYVASWSGWFFSHGGYNRAWAAHRDSAVSWVPGVFRSWWHYQYDMYHFDATLTAGHPYQSSPWGWLLIARPMLYYAMYPTAGQLGCTDVGRGCARMIYDNGNPLIWWAAIPALLFCVYLWWSRRDWRATTTLVMFAFGFGVWLALAIMHPERTMFYFYMTPVVPFLCIAVTLALAHVIGPTSASPNRRMWGAIIVGAYLLLVVIIFFYFQPIQAAYTIPRGGYDMRMWLPSWV